MPTATLEEYLEAIYRQAEQGAVRPTALAEAMQVSGPTVTATLRRLQDRGLITREGTEVVLTDEGRVLAVDIIRRHRVAERFLVDTLGLDWDVAHDEACTLEHALSPRVMEALESFLENPESCPHGHPIPAIGAALESKSDTPLADVPAGFSVSVLRVAEDDDEVLAYLGTLGLFPGTFVTVTEVAPFGGPLTLEVNGHTVAVARDIATGVQVAPVEECS